MALSGLVEAAPNGAVGFDCSAPLTAASAKALRKEGFQFAIRYLTRGTTPPAGDLSAAEATVILGAGLALMAVQHVEYNYPPGWAATAAKGATNGKNAAAHALLVGLPAGVTLWLDLEGVGDGVSADDVVAYCNAWFQEVSAVGFDTGVYVGANCRLSGDELYWRLKTKRYWRSGSSVPDIPQRGYCMRQRIKSGDTVGGVEIDRDVVVLDAFGGTPSWLTQSPATVAVPPPAVLLLPSSSLVSDYHLDPVFAATLQTLLDQMKAAGHDFRISQGLRTPQKQAEYYCRYPKRTPQMAQAAADKLKADGAPWLASLIEDYKDVTRTQWLTDAMPGAGWHQWGLAADCYCFQNGNPVNNGSDPRYKTYADAAQALGLRAGYYFSKQDSGHVQGPKESGAASTYTWPEIDATMRQRFGDKNIVALAKPKSKSA